MNFATARLVFVIAALLIGAGAASAQTKITVGKVVGGVGLHIPSYIAMDKGFFKEEGLDARFVELAGRPLMTAGLSGNVDFIPIPSGGAQVLPQDHCVHLLSCQHSALANAIAEHLHHKESTVANLTTLDMSVRVPVGACMSVTQCARAHRSTSTRQQHAETL